MKIIPKTVTRSIDRNSFFGIKCDLSSLEEAELVLERMNDIIDTCDVVSVANLNDLVGLPTKYVDNKWGWNYLGDVQIYQTCEGYLIDFPPAELVQ